MNLILLGAPGTGKGTLAEGIRTASGVPHISSGDIFRQNIKDGTPLGKEAEGYMSRGELVPDATTIAMVEDRLSQGDCADGFLLDGYPRTLSQAESLGRFLARRGTPIDAVLNIRLADATIQDRLSGRRVCPACGRSYNLPARPPKAEGICDACGAAIEHRKDDQPETIAVRLRSYHAKTKPLVDYYEALGLLHDFDNEQGSDITIGHILTSLEELRRKRSQT
jgi:adenylate kinase